MLTFCQFLWHLEACSTPKLVQTYCTCMGKTRCQLSCYKSCPLFENLSMDSFFAWDGVTRENTQRGKAARCATLALCRPFDAVIAKTEATSARSEDRVAMSMADLCAGRTVPNNRALRRNADLSIHPGTRDQFVGSTPKGSATRFVGFVALEFCHV